MKYFISYDYTTGPAMEEPEFNNLFSAIKCYIKLTKCKDIDFVCLYKNKPSKYSNITTLLKYTKEEING